MNGSQLGPRQQGSLECLRRFGQWPGGWTWGSNSETITILESLVRRGLARKETLTVMGHNRTFYYPTKEDQS